MNTILNYISLAKKKGSSEYATACPSCGGDDRFLIWPYRDKGGFFHCRQCGIEGDGIRFLREFRNMDFFEACDALGIDKEDLRSYKHEPRKVWTPPSLWQSNAKSFLRSLQNAIASKPDAVKALSERGITPRTALLCNLGFSKHLTRYKYHTWGLEPENGKDLLYIPAGLIAGTVRNKEIVALNVRRPDEDMEKWGKHHYVKGGAWLPYCVGDIGKPLFIVESILDAILLWQEMENKVAVIALKGLSCKVDEYAQGFIDNTPLLMACPDNDDAGDNAWQEWRKVLTKARRARPIGKDIGDMYKRSLHDKNVPSVKAWAEYCIKK